MIFMMITQIGVKQYRLIKRAGLYEGWKELSCPREVSQNCKQSHTCTIRNILFVWKELAMESKPLNLLNDFWHAILGFSSTYI